MTRSNAMGRIGIVFCALALAYGCGDDDAASIMCGSGTMQKGSECVPASAGRAAAGSGGTQGGSAGKPADKPDSGVPAVAVVSCGPGTIESMGKCIPDPKMPPCGDGTIPQDGKCLVAPPPPPNIESLVISQLSLRTSGQLVVDGDSLLQYYPVQVSVGLKYKGDKAKIPVVFALAEPPHDNKAPGDLMYCLLGGFDIDHPGGTDETESIASATFQIPKSCLKAGAPAVTVSPVVMVDPERALGAKDQDAVTRMVGFMKDNKEDEDLAACRVDTATNGAKGTCAVAAKLEASPGIDFELAELTAESSVVVLDKCAAGSDLDRPESYRCNTSIVPEFKLVLDGAGHPARDANGNTQVLLDADGKPTQATYTDNGTEKPRWVYGVADLALDVTVMTYGDDDSKIANGTQAQAVAADKPGDATNNVLADHGLQIRYSIRPANDDSSWKPLYLHEQGEQAKAGEAAESGQNPANFEETNMTPATPSYYTHGLYVENDCGERNKATCDVNLKPRTDIVSGAWSNTTEFIVRACLIPVDTSGAEAAAFDKNPKNNCKEMPIKIVRHDTSASSGSASSYGFNYQWADGAGGQATLRLGWGFHTWNKLDASGLSIDNEGALTVGSNLIGYQDILKGWAKGAAYTNLLGSYYDYGFSLWGNKLLGDAKQVLKYHWEQTWSVTKDLSRSTIVFAGVIPVQLTIRFAGTAGLTLSLDLVATNVPLAAGEESETFLNTKAAGVQRLGLAQLAITPFGNITVTASAAITAGLVRVGIAGDLVLMELRLPATGRLWFGATQLTPSVKLKFGAWADLKATLTVMSGEIYLFAENQVFDWCTKRIKKGFIKITVKYPCTEWSTFWDFDIADWDGWTWNQTLWTSPYAEAVIP